MYGRNSCLTSCAALFCLVRRWQQELPHGHTTRHAATTAARETRTRGRTGTAMEDIAHADMVDTLPGTTSSSIGVGREGSCCFPSESASACFVYDESARLSAVARSAMLGALTDEDGVFQLIVDTAGEITASPMASISIVGREENFTRAVRPTRTTRDGRKEPRRVVLGGRPI